MSNPDLTGSWQLDTTSAWDDEGTPMPAPFGPTPRGLVAFYDNGRMMCVLTDGRVDMPPGEVREYSTYTGQYQYDGQHLITRVDGSVDTDRIGGDQVREVEFVGERLILRPPVRTRDGRREHRQLEWIRRTDATS
ncbi:MAG: lipocalin-like domain-containing protein [Pseudomonadota bacterium]